MPPTSYIIRAFAGTLVSSGPPLEDISALLEHTFGPLASLLAFPFFGLGSGLPTTVAPRLPYAANGIPLENQPGVRTAPAPSSQVVLAGSSFGLVFSSPSSTTQAILASGTHLIFQFALADGRMVTGPVQVTSTLIDSTFVCLFVTSEDIHSRF